MARGEVVAWLCGNTHELLEAYYGVLLAGAVLLPLNIRLSSAELRDVLAQSRATVLFRHPDQPDPSAPVRQVLLGAELEAALARQAPGPVEPDVRDENDPAEIFFTSGSTGMPKGAVLTHRNLYLHAIHNALTNDITGDDVILHLVPLFHVNGWGMPFATTGMGVTQVVLRKVDGAEILRRVDDHGVTLLCGAPAVVAAVLDAAAQWDGPVPGRDRVRMVVAGAPPPTRTTSCRPCPSRARSWTRRSSRSSSTSARRAVRAPWTR